MNNSMMEGEKIAMKRKNKTMADERSDLYSL